MNINEHILGGGERAGCQNAYSGHTRGRRFVTLTSNRLTCSSCAGHLVDKTPNIEVRSYFVICIEKNIFFKVIGHLKKIKGFLKSQR